MQKLIKVTRNADGNFIIELDSHSAKTYIQEYDDVTDKIPAWTIEIIRSIKFAIEKERRS